MSKPKQMYRKDLINIMAKETGYTIDTIKYILNVRDEVIINALEQGVSFKDLKMMQMKIENQKPKRAWDGLNKVYYPIPEKKVLKFKPLSEVIRAISTLNEEEKD